MLIYVDKATKKVVGRNDIISEEHADEFVKKSKDLPVEAIFGDFIIPEQPCDTDGVALYFDGEFYYKEEPVEIEPTPVDEPIDTEILLCETLSVAEYNSCLLEMMM